MNTDELITSGFLIPPVSFRNNNKKNFDLPFYYLKENENKKTSSCSKSILHP